MTESETGWRHHVTTEEAHQEGRYEFARELFTAIERDLDNDKIGIPGMFANLQETIDAEILKQAERPTPTPNTPSDFEQLTRLRETLESVDKWFSDHFAEIPCTIPIGPITAQLREALAHSRTGE